MSRLGSKRHPQNSTSIIFKSKPLPIYLTTTYNGTPFAWKTDLTSKKNLFHYLYNHLLCSKQRYCSDHTRIRAVISPGSVGQNNTGVSHLHFCPIGAWERALKIVAITRKESMFVPHNTQWNVFNTVCYALVLQWYAFFWGDLLELTHGDNAQVMR